MTYLAKRPVAFRIRRSDADTAGTTLSETDWRYFSNEDDAWKASDALGTEYQALFVRDGAAIVGEWEPIESAPKGDDDFFLVCGVGDERCPFVICGAILWGALDRDRHKTPSHLHMNWLTHWMPLPAPPVR